MFVIRYFRKFSYVIEYNKRHRFYIRNWDRLELGGGEEDEGDEVSEDSGVSVG